MITNSCFDIYSATAPGFNAGSVKDLVDSMALREMFILILIRLPFNFGGKKSVDKDCHSKVLIYWIFLYYSMEL